MKIEPESIQEGVNDEHIRSEEHRKFLIDAYNKGKCPEHQVSTMKQLIKKLEEEITK